MPLTTAAAAEVAGLDRAAFRKAVSRERVRGVELQAPRATWPDARTPMYDADAIAAWVERRTK